MPRNSQGDYSLPAGSLVNTGDTLLVSQHNPPLQDLQNAISSSLDRDGKGGMRAPLAMNGNKITGVAPGTAGTDVATVSQIGNAISVPVGCVVDYWGATPPDGYLFAAGQAVSRTTYAALFAIIGTAAGAGDGSTTFNLPDYRGRVGAGRESMVTPATTRLNTLSSSTVGASGGSQTHALTIPQLPAHTHTGSTESAGNHTHSLGRRLPGAGPTDAVFLQDTASSAQLATEAAGNHTHTMNLDNTGSNEAHNNVQPTIICNKIIRAL